MTTRREFMGGVAALAVTAGGDAFMVQRFPKGFRLDDGILEAVAE